MEDAVQNEFFLFINTKSGGGQGQQYLTIQDKVLTYRFESSPQTTIHLINLFNEKDRKEAMTLACQYSLLANKQVRLVICGGDGTIMWVISQALAHNIDLDKVVFAILPIGTGNDFSRSLGWGYSLRKFSEHSLDGLTEIVRDWVRAKVTTYDVWDVQLETYPNGCIYDIKSQVEIKRQDKTLKRCFTNYCGMGLDARVVYTVQQRRTSYAFLNKVVYGCIGFCNFFLPMRQLIETVQTFMESDSQSQDNLIPNQDLDLIPNQKTSQQIKKKFITKQDSSILDNINPNLKNVIIKKGYRGLVCLNCPSYMAGLRNVWQTSKVGRKIPKGEEHRKFTPQLYNDGMIEFVGYKSQLNLALERIMRSGAKITQGPGPFHIQMKKPEDNNPYDSYIQIDGESVKVVNLKSIKINQSEKINGGKIKVLAYNQQDKQ